MFKKQQIIQGIEEIPELLTTVIWNCIELIKSHEQPEVLGSLLFSDLSVRNGWLTKEEEQIC